MRYLVYLCIICAFKQVAVGQSQGVTNSQTKLRPNQLRWSPTDATLDSVYIIRADTATGEPGWYLVTLSGGGGVQDTTLAGDVVGGLNSTFVRKINGVTVENITPQNREVLTYNGTQWTPDSIALEDLPQINASRVLGRGSSSAGAVTQLTPSNGVKISGNYIESDLTAGTGINISGTTTLTVSNSAPDQTVTISGATGTYPNFTVTPTAPGGSSGQVQYNNAGSFGALDSFTVSANPDRVGIGVPSPVARLDIQGSGSTSATNALRVRNSAGTEIMAIGNDSQVKITATTTASKSALILSGTGYSGGTATTTKPTLLIEPTGTTSTAWSTSGTKLGVNAESGFTGNLLDLQVNGSSKVSVSDATNTLDINGSGSTSATNALRVRNSAGTNLLTVRNDGALLLGTNTTSDYVKFNKEREVNSSTYVFSNPGATEGYNSNFLFKTGANNVEGVGVFRIYSNSSSLAGSIYVGNVSESMAQSNNLTTNFAILNKITSTTAFDNAISVSPNNNMANYSLANGKQFGIFIGTGNDGYSLSNNSSTGYGAFIGMQKNPLSNGYASDLVINTKNESGVSQETFRFVGKNNSVGHGINTPLAGHHNAINTTASTPSMLLSGTGYSGGTSTTTKPTLLIEPTGTTSTGWITSGTKLGVNAESGFTGRYLDIQLAGVSKFNVQADKINMSTSKTPSSATDTGTTGDICWDANYIYVCVGTNTWKRTAITTW